jgi:DNA-binding GntR family transcriptional regulator
LIRESTGIATLEEWAKLDLNAHNSRVLRVTNVRHDESCRPLALEEVVIALERFPGFSPNGSSGIPDITELARRHGLRLGRASERVAIVRVSKDVASHLQIPAGTDVMKLNRVVETADGEPVEWRVTFRKL